MLDLMDVSSEIQESLGRSYNLPDDIDEDELLGGKIFLLLLVHIRSCEYILQTLEKLQILCFHGDSDKKVLIMDSLNGERY